MRSFLVAKEASHACAPSFLMLVAIKSRIEEQLLFDQIKAILACKEISKKLVSWRKVRNVL